MSSSACYREKAEKDTDEKVEKEIDVMILSNSSRRPV